MRTVYKDDTAALQEELAEYEDNTEMTEKERKALREWVHAGNSVHDNGSMACTEYGTPCDFLDVYRYEEGIRSDLEKLSKMEQENYLARLRGTDTIDNLRRALDRMRLCTAVYERVLRKNGLLEKAVLMIEDVEKETSENTWELEKWLEAHPEEELPFE